MHPRRTGVRCDEEDFGDGTQRALLTVATEAGAEPAEAGRDLGGLRCRDVRTLGGSRSLVSCLKGR
jgi:hypothetical protein